MSDVFSSSSAMTSPFSVSAFSDTKSKIRLYLYRFFIGVSLVCFTYFIGSALVAKDYREKISKWPMEMMATADDPKSNFCKCRPPGSAALPEGIVVQSSNFEMRPLWDSSLAKEKRKPPLSLLAMAVGVKQKEIVNKMVEKFLSNGFVIMLFHYDGIVDEWSALRWNDLVIHVSAKNQTKWDLSGSALAYVFSRRRWFAKRFLHPDVVADYDYVFLWDEDLDVENFNPQRYISIIKSEGLEISQPALDTAKSVVHHPITARRKNARVHRRYYKSKGSGRCDENSKSPPCTGWVEMMAPAFSKVAWQCVWYMIQNDLIHAWGLDRQLGYCAQGDRIKNVGVVDSEYIVHLGLPTLGVLDQNKESSEPLKVDNRSAPCIVEFAAISVAVKALSGSKTAKFLQLQAAYAKVANFLISILSTVPAMKFRSSFKEEDLKKQQGHHAAPSSNSLILQISGSHRK